MRIAVTGGSGKLGRSVVRRLTQDGHEVLNMDRAGTRGRGLRQRGPPQLRTGPGRLPGPG